MSDESANSGSSPLGLAEESRETVLPIRRHTTQTLLLVFKVTGQLVNQLPLWAGKPASLPRRTRTMYPYPVPAERSLGRPKRHRLCGILDRVPRFTDLWTRGALSSGSPTPDAVPWRDLHQGSAPPPAPLIPPGIGSIGPRDIHVARYLRQSSWISPNHTSSRCRRSLPDCPTEAKCRSAWSPRPRVTVRGDSMGGSSRARS